jgi:hypothetical protein
LQHHILPFRAFIPTASIISSSPPALIKTRHCKG